MKALENRIQEFLSSNKTQFVIPVYQRNYDWAKSQCKQLLDDIFEIGRDENKKAHFIGSIVFIHQGVYTSSSIKELSIIDGQQRLTTISLLYLVLYKFAKEIKDMQMEEEIYVTYLINKFAAEDEKLKLKPTDNNDRAFKHLLSDEPIENFKGFSNIIENFKYFKSRINHENYEILKEGLNKLIFVEISLDKDKDDPQRIFESLNSTGLDLEQADLIRNYILMGLNNKDQNKIYKDYWEIIEQFAKDEKTKVSKVSDFIRDYLTLKNKNIPNKNKVYTEFRDKYPTTNNISDLERTLNSLKTLSKHYNKLINPNNEEDVNIKQQLLYIQKLEINVAHPFLIQVLEDYSNNIIDKITLINILELIQSFTWRRFIVGLPTNALNKIFMSLYDKIDTLNYLNSIERELVRLPGTSRFPNDIEIEQFLKQKDMYNIQSKNRTYFFDRMENFENKEKVVINNLSIEHIFPQNPDNKWFSSLSVEEISIIKEKYLNTIGNLTLTGYNSELSNKSFIDKKEEKDFGFNNSRLWLNKNLEKVNEWNVNEIEKRCNLLIERFFQIWKIPKVEILVNNYSEVNIFDAETPKFKKLEYAIFMEERIEVREVSKLYTEVIKKIFSIQPEAFIGTELQTKIGLTSNPIQNNLRQPISINEIYFIEGNIDSNGKFDRLKFILKELELEDDLFVKYSDYNTKNDISIFD